MIEKGRVTNKRIAAKGKRSMKLEKGVVTTTGIMTEKVGGN